jgi:hypothetical protein
MASFTVRVELHDASGADYLRLHEAMEAQGFDRTIKSDEGIIYRLPEAEYNRVGALTRDDVIAEAKRGAAATGKRYSVLVTESNGRKWSGLERVS